jgi:hypothetical protein
MWRSGKLKGGLDAWHETNMSVNVPPRSTENLKWRPGLLLGLGAVGGWAMRQKIQDG